MNQTPAPILLAHKAYTQRARCTPYNALICVAPGCETGCWLGVHTTQRLRETGRGVELEIKHHHTTFMMIMKDVRIRNIYA